MKKIDKALILNICTILLFVSGIITIAAGGNTTVGLLFNTSGFLFLTVGISFRRREDAQTEKKEDETNNKE